MAHGVVHWRVKPQVCGWNLPAAHVVQDALVEALHTPASLRARSRLTTKSKARPCWVSSWTLPDNPEDDALHGRSTKPDPMIGLRTPHFGGH